MSAVCAKLTLSQQFGCYLAHLPSPSSLWAPACAHSGVEVEVKCVAADLFIVLSWNSCCVSRAQVCDLHSAVQESCITSKSFSFSSRGLKKLEKLQCVSSVCKIQLFCRTQISSFHKRGLVSHWTVDYTYGELWGNKLYEMVCMYFNCLEDSSCRLSFMWLCCTWPYGVLERLGAVRQLFKLSSRCKFLSSCSLRFCPVKDSCSGFSNDFNLRQKSHKK